MTENRRAPSPLAPNHDDVLQGKPQPKWWLMHALNYVVMAIFLGSVGLHVSRTSFGLRRDATRAPGVRYRARAAAARSNRNEEKRNAAGPCCPC